MSATLLTANTGRSTGSPESRRLRTEDLIPAIVYGQGITPLSVTVVRRELRKALSGSAGLNTVLDLSVDGKVYPAVVKQLQRHPVRRSVQHVDFLHVDLNEDITVSIPVRLEGEAIAVLQAKGMVDPAVDTIEVRTTPRNIPDEIVIDITDMTPDSVITLGDLTFPAGVVPTGDPSLPVATVLLSHEEEEPADEAGEGVAEGADAGDAGDAAAE